MATDKLIPFVYQSWADADFAVEGLTDEEATTRYDGASSIAWTYGHLANMVDSWLNAKFQGLARNSIVGSAEFGAGGTGAAEDWPAISAAVREVRASARCLLDNKPPPDLDRVSPYDGAVAYLHPIGLSLRHALLRIAAHHFTHAGEILAIRSRLGHQIEDVRDWGRTFA